MKSGTRNKKSIESKVTLSIRISKKEKQALIEEAKRRNITVTRLVRKKLQEILNISDKSSQWPNPRPLGIKEFSREELYE